MGHLLREHSSLVAQGEGESGAGKEEKATQESATLDTYFEYVQPSPPKGGRNARIKSKNKINKNEKSAGTRASYGQGARTISSLDMFINRSWQRKFLV